MTLLECYAPVTTLRATCAGAQPDLVAETAYDLRSGEVASHASDLIRIPASLRSANRSENVCSILLPERTRRKRIPPVQLTFGLFLDGSTSPS